MLIATKWFGVFLIDGDKVVKTHLFPKDPSGIATRLHAIQKGHILDEERAAAQGKRVNVLESRLEPLGRMVVADASFVNAATYGFRETLLKEALLLLAEMKTEEETGADRHLMEAIASYDAAQEQINQLDLKLHSWYGLHYPELGDALKGIDYSKAVSSYGDRESVQEGIDLSGASIGVDFIEGEKEMLMSLASGIIYLTDLSEKTGEYIDRRAQEVLPNLSALLGPKLACRLVREAGGLERLSSFPAGTVQLIGAEKALFRHLRKGRRPPKHGLIFQHPLVHSMPRDRRGRMSRFIGGKAAIAARLDMYRGRDMGEELKREAEKRAEELRSAPAAKKRHQSTDPRASGGRGRGRE